MIKDPVQEYVDWLRGMAVTLNTNLEGVKVWMSTQHLHNELFLESITDLKAEVKILKEEINKLRIKDAKI
jgi:hypothetical protein